MEQRSASVSNKTHRCSLSDRKKAELLGVTKVVSFDTNEILLDTYLGGLLMKGIDLHINRLDLDKGIVEVEGKVDALIYSDKNSTESSAKGIMSRLFR